ncbi:MAG: 30S ribosomal protein S1 [Thermodesulfobacteriota bacterium]
MCEDEKEPMSGGEEEFAELFESYSGRGLEAVEVGAKVRGEIISIGKENVFVDIGAKSDGVVEKAELLDDEGEMPFEQGDTLELYVVSLSDNEVRLSKAISRASAPRFLRDAFDKSIPVEGKVKGLIKGGFHVELMHRRAFCPLGQIDLRYVENPEAHVGNTYNFLITQFDEEDRNIVVSRREHLNRELNADREKFLRDLTVGAEREATVKRVLPYGAFLELFPGIEGMVHISELSWARLDKPEEVLALGDTVRVKVIGIEGADQPDAMRITLSMKQLSQDPWDSVRKKFHEGDKAIGRVTRCAEFGAFVEIAPGIEGLVHISEMSYTKRVLRPQDVVDEGEVVSVVIKEIDPEKRRVSLSIKEAEGDPWLEVNDKYHVGQSVEGTFEKKEHFGCFISLEPGITGLLPKSNLARSPDPSSIEKLRQGDAIAVVIEKIDSDERKITLAPSVPGAEAHWRSFAGDSGKSLGSLGEKLQQALKSKKKR